MNIRQLGVQMNADLLEALFFLEDALESCRDNQWLSSKIGAAIYLIQRAQDGYEKRPDPKNFREAMADAHAACVIDSAKAK